VSSSPPTSSPRNQDLINDGGCGLVDHLPVHEDWWYGTVLRTNPGGALAGSYQAPSHVPPGSTVNLYVAVDPATVGKLPSPPLACS
jgi:hypothetical protein